MEPHGQAVKRGKRGGVVHRSTSYEKPGIPSPEGGGDNRILCDMGSGDYGVENGLSDLER